MNPAFIFPFLCAWVSSKPWNISWRLVFPFRFEETMVWGRGEGSVTCSRAYGYHMVELGWEPRLADPDPAFPATLPHTLSGARCVLEFEAAGAVYLMLCYKDTDASCGRSARLWTTGRFCSMIDFSTALGMGSFYSKLSINLTPALLTAWPLGCWLCVCCSCLCCFTGHPPEAQQCV